MLRERRPLHRSEAWSCALINQLATPGLGSLVARRWVAGTIQIVLAIIGFCLIMFWFAQKMRLLYGQMFGTDIPVNAGNQAGQWGLIFFGIAWLWSLLTSIQIVMNAPKSSPPPPKIV